jgi:hypothetical protein
MAEDDGDDTVYCDIQMPLAQGRELLELVNALRESKAHPRLDKVFEHMQYELSTSIDIIENPPTWGPWGQ